MAWNRREGRVDHRGTRGAASVAALPIASASASASGNGGRDGEDGNTPTSNLRGASAGEHASLRDRCHEYVVAPSRDGRETGGGASGAMKGPAASCRHAGRQKKRRLLLKADHQPPFHLVEGIISASFGRISVKSQGLSVQACQKRVSN